MVRFGLIWLNNKMLKKRLREERGWGGGGTGRRRARNNKNEGLGLMDGLNWTGMCWQDQKEGRDLTFLGSFKLVALAL
jgi:hypothetical protein